MSRILAGPFNRVEGDLEITLELSAGRVAAAKVNSPLFRGFERILQGRDPMDALVYTPRICGICSVSQSVASAAALADLMQLSMPTNGRLCTNLVLANESVADLLTHFYLFFMPDFARDIYASEPWHADISARFKATVGSAVRTVLPARAEFLHLMGIMAGKWPHSLSIQPGGSAKPIEAQERVRLLAIVGGFRRFLEQTLFGDDLSVIAGLTSVADLAQWRRERAWNHSDFSRFLHLSEQLSLDTLGRGTDQFLSFGGYDDDAGALWAAGSRLSGEALALNAQWVTEDHAYSWLSQSAMPLAPAQGVTEPDLANSEGYSWCKAPRLQREVVEVGALARQWMNQHPLVHDLVAQGGANVHSRIVARLLELAIVVPQMQRWIKAIDPSAPFCNHGVLPDSGVGVGLVEAARGSLGHWLEVREGKIHNYQIVAPTSWNFSPRDGQGVPGALEQALVGAFVREGEKTPISVQHIVRSFDPCMACTVH